MASNPGNGDGSAPPNSAGQPVDPNQKTLSVWSKPVEAKDVTNERPSISEAVSTIKPEDFSNLANYPCTRNALLHGIGAGFGMGGVRFIVGGNVTKCANWAAGVFVLGSMASYEWCQYLRRCEKRDMKRHIEVINDGRKEHAKKLAEAKKEKLKQQEEQKAAQKAWHKFW